MENIVQKMVEIEEMAAAALDSAYDSQRQLPRRTAEEIDRHVSRVNTETQKAVDRLYQDAAREVEIKIKDITQQSWKASRQVEDAFAQYRAQWRAELTRRIICDSHSKP
jgi:hypothetical protein